MPSNPSIFDLTNTGGAVGNREDLSGSPEYLYPDATPVTAITSVRSAHSYFVDGTIDKIAPPTNVPVGEGEDVTNPEDQFKDMGRYRQVITTRRVSFGITDFQQNVDSADEVSYARSEYKAQRQLNVQKELAILSDEAKNDTNELQAEGLTKQLSATSTVVTDDLYRTPASSRISGDATETNVNSLINSLYNISGDAGQIMWFQDTELATNFAEQATRLASTPTNAKLQLTIDAKEGYIPMEVTIWRGPRGAVAVKPLNPQTTTNQVDRDTGLFLNPAFLEMRTIKGREALGPYDNGGGPFGAVQENFAICATDPRAHGLYTSL